MNDHPFPKTSDYVGRRLEGERETFRVSLPQFLAGEAVRRFRKFWLLTGGLESSFLEDELEKTTIVSPAYVCALARGGTTILLECLYRTGAFASHLYKDYPYIDIPVIWNRTMALSGGGRKAVPRERAHLDGIMVTPDSPEALEEMIWMGFFRGIHNSAQSLILGRSTSNPDFEKYYRDHMRKILMVRGRERYLAKGNYNFTRIEYLLKIFPDAKFIIPLREPEAHIASLMKQHLLFSEVEKTNAKALSYMNNVGHFEFGLNRRVINAGNDEIAGRIAVLRDQGREAEGWAWQWLALYGWFLGRLCERPELKRSVLIVPYGDFCTSSREWLEKIFRFAGVEEPEAKAAEQSGFIKAPGYYRPELTEDETEIIRKITASVYNDLLTLAG